MHYLKEKQEYIDRYDKWTVESCRDHERFAIDAYKNLKEEDRKKLNPEGLVEFMLYFHTGNR